MRIARRGRESARSGAATALRWADWPPPYLLEGDTWALFGFAPARAVRDALPDGRPLSLLGWTPVVLQATSYWSAQSLTTGKRVAYVEVSATAFQRHWGWGLLPVTLLVDHPLSVDLGQAYGFPKQLAEVHVTAGAWALTAAAGEGRTCTATRVLGALLLTPLCLLLGRSRLRVHLPAQSAATTFTFRGVQRVAPALGAVSPAFRRWACDTRFVLPLGVAIQGFRFEIDGPRAA